MPPAESVPVAEAAAEEIDVVLMLADGLAALTTDVLMPAAVPSPPLDVAAVVALLLILFVMVLVEVVSVLAGSLPG